MLNLFNSGEYRNELMDELVKEEDERILNEVEMYINKELKQQQETQIMYRVYATFSKTRNGDPTETTELGRFGALANARATARSYKNKNFYARSARLVKTSDGKYKARDMAFSRTVIVEPILSDITIFSGQSVPAKKSVLSRNSDSGNLSDLLMP